MMMKVDLVRIEQGPEGTFGVMRLDGRAYCVTLEPPDMGNRENISCIPAGRYICRRVASPRFGQTFEVDGVLDRNHILLHPGNVADDTHGCILLGKHFGLLRGDRAVLNSGATFADFMRQCSDVEEFSLVVENVYREVPWTTSA